VLVEIPAGIYARESYGTEMISLKVRRPKSDVSPLFGGGVRALVADAELELVGATAIDIF
jgi:hypothetical protein